MGTGNPDRSGRADDPGCFSFGASGESESSEPEETAYQRIKRTDPKKYQAILQQGRDKYKELKKDPVKYQQYLQRERKRYHNATDEEAEARAVRYQEYRQANRKKLSEKQKAWRHANRDRHNATRRAYYARHKEYINAKRRQARIAKKQSLVEPTSNHTGDVVPS